MRNMIQIALILAFPVGGRSQGADKTVTAKLASGSQKVLRPQSVSSTGTRFCARGESPVW